MDAAFASALRSFGGERHVVATRRGRAGPPVARGAAWAALVGVGVAAFACSAVHASGLPPALSLHDNEYIVLMQTQSVAEEAIDMAGSGTGEEEEAGRRVTMMRHDGVEMSCLLPDTEPRGADEIDNTGATMNTPDVQELIKPLNGTCFLRIEGTSSSSSPSSSTPLSPLNRRVVRATRTVCPGRVTCAGPDGGCCSPV